MGGQQLDGGPNATNAQLTGRAESRETGISSGLSGTQVPTGQPRKLEPKCGLLTDHEHMQGLWTHTLIKARRCTVSLKGRNASFLTASHGLTIQQLGDHSDVHCQGGRGGAGTQQSAGSHLHSHVPSAQPSPSTALPRWGAGDTWWQHA